MAVASFRYSQFLVSPLRSSPLHSSSSKNCTNDSIGHNKWHPPITASAARSTASQYMSFGSSCASTLYQDLGISMGASFPEIKTAYRKLARTCHPDVASADQKDTSAEDFMKIQAAYSTLSDPSKRIDYDRNLFRKSQSRSFGSSRSYDTASGYTSTRNWRTDQCW